MRICALVSTLNVHGGVRRYLELGNAFTDMGHTFDLYAKLLKEQAPWLPFRGNLRQYSECKGQRYDLSITGDSHCFQYLLAQPGRKVVLVVSKFAAGAYLSLWRQVSRAVYWIGVASGWDDGMEEIEGACIPGGVDADFFTPGNACQRDGALAAFYARPGPDRGLDLVMALAQRLCGKIAFVGFDVPGYPDYSAKVPPNVTLAKCSTQEALREVYRRATFVVSALPKAGWNNVIAEGCAAGCIPLCTTAGTSDLVTGSSVGFSGCSSEFPTKAAEYAEALMADRARLGRVSDNARRSAARFSWRTVAESVLSYVGGN